MGKAVIARWKRRRSGIERDKQKQNNFKVDNIETVERISRKYGEEHVELKCFGFKPDFWVSLADAITVECVILDQAAHQVSPVDCNALLCVCCQPLY